MKILWITNIMFPPIQEKLNLKGGFSGGWMVASASQLKEELDVELAVATVHNGSDFIDEVIDGIRYFVLPLNGKSNLKYNAFLCKYWRRVYDSFVPNVVHLHGTEYAHGLAYINECGADNLVVSIQGLTSIISRYYYAGMTHFDILKNITIKDFVFRDTLWQQQHRFKQRGQIEREIISKVQYIIGRTEWDKVHVLAINSKINYFHCDETMRHSFYKNKWDYSKCEPYSIFVSQAGYPLKGLHQVFKAMPFILKKYPEAKIYVGGSDIINKSWYKISGYGRYIKSLIKKYNLFGKIIFLGSLSEDEMCKQYLKSNLFVCPSSIENSSNSLVEAQLLGVPYIASYVGGTPTLMEDREMYLYRYEEVEMLAYKIMEAFEIREPLNSLDIRNRNSEENNINQLIRIYKQI